jgi:hypothetical protein
MKSSRILSCHNKFKEKNPLKLDKKYNDCVPSNNAKVVKVLLNSKLT